ncbi:MAG: DUF3987 domain-containing protein [Clostridiales bacterium]|nr:DUF3987 domain-containing protein [Clostridiales bacterium]
MNDAERGRMEVILRYMSAEDYQALIDEGHTQESIFGQCVALETFALPQAAPTSGPGPWPELTPFTKETPLPSFPTDRLHAPLDVFVEELAASLQVDEVLPGVLALGVLGTLFQKRYRLHVKGQWWEELSIYAVVVAKPSTKKSPAFSQLMAPIRRYEAARRQEEAPEVKASQSEYRMLQQRQAMYEKALAKEDTKDNREALDQVNDELAHFKPRLPYRLTIDDTTPEKLADLLTQYNALGLAAPEPQLLDILQGRYDKHSTGLDYYLKTWAGEQIQIDRIGRDGGTVERPRLSMILACQPSAMNGMMENGTFKGRGLCARFLYGIAHPKVDSRNPDDPPDVEEAVVNDYSAFVIRALHDVDGPEVDLELSPEAQQERVRYNGEVRRLLADELEFMDDWGGKLLGTTLRLAALFHCGWCIHNGESPADSPVSADNLREAEAVMACLSDHAAAAYRARPGDPDEDAARYIWKRLQKYGKTEVEMHKFHELTRSKQFSCPEDKEPALELLQARGYIQQRTGQTGKKGRPPKTIYVNPAALSMGNL